MKTQYLFMSLFLSQVVLAIPPSTIPKVDIRNAHIVAEGQGRVFRGSEPIGKEKQLVRLGVTDVLIFKNQTKAEVDTEKKNLKALGFSDQQIHHIPFEWKRNANEKLQCERLIKALSILVDVYQTEDRAVFFHCTVGEDRTGLLAGLFEQLIEKDKSQAQIFQTQMCERGYEAGDENKPQNVVSEIRAGLTPLYLKVSSLIRSGEISLQRLDARVCSQVVGMKVVQSSKWVCEGNK